MRRRAEAQITESGNQERGIPEQAGLCTTRGETTGFPAHDHKAPPNRSAKGQPRMDADGHGSAASVVAAAARLRRGYGGQARRGPCGNRDGQSPRSPTPSHFSAPSGLPVQTPTRDQPRRDTNLHEWLSLRFLRSLLLSRFEQEVTEATELDPGFRVFRVFRGGSVPQVFPHLPAFLFNLPHAHPEPLRSQLTAWPPGGA